MDNEVKKAGRMPALHGVSAAVARKVGSVAALRMEAVEFVKAYSPLPAMRQCAEVDTPVKAAMNMELPTLVAIRQEYGEAFIIGYIKLWIVDLIEYLGGKELTDAQLEETSLRIYHNNYYLNIADLNILLNRVKDGDTVLTTPINGAKLNALFATYRDERAEAVVASHENEHEVLKKHGYIPHVDHITEAVHEAMIENQMAAAERQAKAEEAEIDRLYRKALRYQKLWDKYPQLKPKTKDEQPQEARKANL